MRETLAALTGLTLGSLQVCVVDDASHDGTADVAANAGCEVYRLGERMGVVRSRYELMKWACETGCEWFCFLDSDVIVTEPDWLQRLIATHKDGLTTAKLLLPNGMVWGAGGCWQRNPTLPSGIEATLRGFHKPDLPEFNHPAQVPHIPTAVAFASMDLLKRGLRIDTSGGNLRTCEDTDLSLTVQFEFGESCWYEPIPFLHNAHSHRHNYRQRTPEMVRYLAECEAGRTFFWDKWGDRIRRRWHV